MSAEHALLVPRKKVYYAPSEGRFIPLSKDIPEVLKQPHIRLEEGVKGPLQGFESGARSGIVIIEDAMYKLKASRPSREDHHGSPFGTQIYPTAMAGAEKLLERRRKFLEKGYPYPAEPKGVWVYDHIRYKRYRTAAPIYQIEGDTRFDELLWWVEKAPLNYISPEDREELRQLLGFIALSSGQLLRVMHDSGLFWDQEEEGTSNAHDGNVVIFPGADLKMAVGLVDFDNSLSYLPHQSHEGMPPVETVRERDQRTFRSGLTHHSVVSTSKYENWHPHDIAKKYAAHEVATRFPEISEVDRDALTSYLLDQLYDAETPLSRYELQDRFQEGYDGTVEVTTAPNWNVARDVRYSLKKMHQGFHERAGKILTKDLNTLLDDAQRFGFFAGYEFPIVVEKGVVSIHPPERTDDPEKISPISDYYPRVAMILTYHQIAHGQKAFGEAYFEFPQIGVITKEYQRLDVADIRGIVQGWINGELYDRLHSTHTTRNIGMLLLGLCQIKGFQIADAIKQFLPTIDDPKFLEKLVRTNELVELLPRPVRRERDMYDYLYELPGMTRRNAHNIEKEIVIKSGMNLFAYGIITREFGQIFNHMKFDIILNDFETRHVQALEAALQCPDRVEHLIGRDNVTLMMSLGLSGAQVRAGRQDLALLDWRNEKGELADSSYVQFFFADRPTSEIHSLTLLPSLTRPLTEDDLAWIAQRLIVAGKPVHPDSFFAQNLRENVLSAENIVKIVTAALDFSGGDISKVDPYLMSAISRPSYFGTVTPGPASTLTLSCIGYGVDIPQIAKQCFESEENRQSFMHVLGPHADSHFLNKYHTLTNYPTHVIHAIMSRGLEALPPTIRQLFTTYGMADSVKTAWANSILEHLFDNGFYAHYFPNWQAQTEGYPAPTIKPKDVWVSPKDWVFWKLVHPDIWEILGGADPQILKNFVHANKDKTIRLELGITQDGMQGFREFSLSELIPPHLFALAKKK